MPLKAINCGKKFREVLEYLELSTAPSSKPLPGPTFVIPAG